MTVIANSQQISSPVTQHASKQQEKSIWSKLSVTTFTVASADNYGAMLLFIVDTNTEVSMAPLYS